MEMARGEEGRYGNGERRRRAILEVARGEGRGAMGSLEPTAIKAYSQPRTGRGDVTLEMGGGITKWEGSCMGGGLLYYGTAEPPTPLWSVTAPCLRPVCRRLACVPGSTKHCSALSRPRRLPEGVCSRRVVGSEEDGVEAVPATQTTNQRTCDSESESAFLRLG